MTSAYLIDPLARTVTRVERHASPGTPAALDEIYALLGCRYIEAVVLPDCGADVLYVDEEGKLNGDPGQQYFSWASWPHDVFAGKALWTGTTSDGQDTDPACTLKYVREHIGWQVPI